MDDHPMPPAPALGRARRSPVSHDHPGRPSPSIGAVLAPFAVALGFVTVAASLPGGPTRADTIPDLPEPEPQAAVLESDRPHAAGGALYWRGHRLAALCGELGGAFAKLRGSSVYACLPADSTRKGTDQ